MIEKEFYWLIDTHSGQRDYEPSEMTVTEAVERNQYMERQNSRWRWLNKTELAAFEEIGRN